MWYNTYVSNEKEDDYMVIMPLEEAADVVESASSSSIVSSVVLGVVALLLIYIVAELCPKIAEKVDLLFKKAPERVQKYDDGLYDIYAGDLNNIGDNDNKDEEEQKEE